MNGPLVFGIVGAGWRAEFFCRLAEAAPERLRVAGLVAEQYLLMPGHFARKAIVDAGVIGVPTFVEVASTHLYHAISMMRGLLGAGFDPVRGALGEIVDDEVMRLADGTVVRSPLSYRRLGVDLDLAGNELDSISFDGRILHRNAWRGCRFSEDDLADACQDHLLGLAIEESACTGREVVTEIEAWTTGV